MWGVSQPWPDGIIWFVTILKTFFGFFRDHSFFGVPLDLPFRFVGIGFLYWILRKRVSLVMAFSVCLGILLAKELFDMFAVRALRSIHWPEIADLLDLLSGLAGMAFAESVRKRKS